MDIPVHFFLPTHVDVQELLANLPAADLVIPTCRGQLATMLGRRGPAGSPS